MANRLASETSPYLRQHKDNPVDWYPWGEEALHRARVETKPILLSIGYSSCHWCHVMERESFEDTGTADYMNRHFVCVKVDREERPDLDAIYMEACQAMTGRGGWPLNCFLTPGQVPFYAGTYFPREPHAGTPTWRGVLEAVVDAWATRRFQIDLGAERILERLGAASRSPPSTHELGPDTLTRVHAGLADAYDAEHGGFGSAPKFPPASAIEFLLGIGETRMSVHTLRAMASGGIYDQIGGGFSRYAVDAAWVIPHFEKMLYDNALLARAYLHGWQVTGEPLFQAVCCETLDWALVEMRGPEGGFYAARDADSEGVEGRFYTWTLDELRQALHGNEEAIEWFGASRRGNFEDTNILVRAASRGEPPAGLEDWRRGLYRVRSRRAWPARDEKRLTAWNALMISALADAGATLRRPDYLAAAVRCAEFVDRDLRDEAGTLLRSFTDGQARLTAYLEDYAFLLEALLTLYECTFDPRWFSTARSLADTLIERFADDERGGFFQTASDHERLLARPKDLRDTPTPAGSSSAAYGLLRLFALTGEPEYERRALGVLRLAREPAVEHPQSFGHALQALAFHLAEVKEVALVGSDTSDLELVVRAAFRPHVVLAGGAADEVPLLAGRAPVDGRATAYVCERFACRRPVTEPEELSALLSAGRPSVVRGAPDRVATADAPGKDLDEPHGQGRG